MSRSIRSWPIILISIPRPLFAAKRIPEGNIHESNAISRGFTGLLAIAAIFLGGCRSQSPRFLHLEPDYRKTKLISKGKAWHRNAVIGIGPVKLADYLDQLCLSVRTRQQ